MLSEQRYQEATNIICEYQLQDYLELKPLLQTLIEKNKIHEAELLSAESIVLQRV